MRTGVRGIAAAAPFDPAPLMAGAIALAAWFAVYASLAHPGLAVGTPLAHAVGALWQWAIASFEAGVLLALVSHRRVRVPYGRTVAALLVISLVQAAVVALQACAWAWPEWRDALAPLAGAGVHWPPGVPRDGFALAWGQTGLLALVRVAATAEWLHAHRVPRARAWATVAACYGAARALAWWSADLLRGASPLG